MPLFHYFDDISEYEPSLELHRQADQRKEWISRCTGEEFVDHSQPTLTLEASRSKRIHMA